MKFNKFGPGFASWPISNQITPLTKQIVKLLSRVKTNLRLLPTSTDVHTVPTIKKCSAILCDEISVFRIGILISNVARSCSFRSFHVSFQSSLPRKPLLTFTTLKWFDTVMNIRDVLLKSSLLRETSLTFGTRKSFHTLMNCQDVPL